MGKNVQAILVSVAVLLGTAGIVQAQPPATGNTAYIEQVGNYNEAVQTQTGQSNYAATIQQLESNIAEMNQEGSDNSAEMTQRGNSNNDLTVDALLTILKDYGLSPAKSGYFTDDWNGVGGATSGTSTRTEVQIWQPSM